MTAKVSVIIPVYNASGFLIETIDKITNQTLTDIEIIFVDDGSTDSSPKILDAAAISDNRIKVIHQDNMGAGAARNAGLDMATGEYLSILDPDDIYETDMLETAYSKITGDGSEICVFGCDMISESGEKSSGDWALRREYLPQNIPFAGYDIPDRLYFTFIGWAWDKLFLRKFVEENGLRFQEQRTTNDMLFVFSALTIAKRITVDGRVLIHQRRRDNSLSTTRDKTWNCFYLALSALGGFLREQNLYERFERGYINYCVHFSLWNLNTISGVSYGKLYNAIRHIYFPEWRVAERSDGFFMNRGELGQAKRIIGMTLGEYAANAASSGRNRSGESEELRAIKNSVSYKIGRLITSVPRFLRKRK